MASADSVALADEKRALRGAMGDARSRLTPEERARAARGVAAQLAALPELRAAAATGSACVAGFSATRAEIDPAMALADARRSGARLAWPRVATGAAAVAPARDRPRLHFHLSEPDDLRPGSFGIPEPEATAPEIAPTDVAVMLVPGLAFDAGGNRLGFGGGFYDELLAGPVARRPAFVVGVGYDFQVVDLCPAGEEDARVDCVVTEARVIRCHGAGTAAAANGKVEP
jgi:5-formyltetrahydrofolate cyclo-ligase